MKRIADWAFDLKLEEMDEAFYQITVNRNLTYSQKDKLKKTIQHFGDRIKTIKPV